VVSANLNFQSIQNAKTLYQVHASNHPIIIVCLYLYCHLRSNYQQGRVGIPLTALTLPHVCACPKPGPRFPSANVMVYFVFSDLMCEVVVRFDDMGGIDDHHCLNFLNIMYQVVSIYFSFIRDKFIFIFPLGPI
jgi:hypothetical protein